MEPHLKERLIGAAVLVALGVWLIPWILDGPAPETAETSSALELPAAEETPAMRTQTIDLEARRAPVSPSPVQTAEAPRVNDTRAESSPPAEPAREESAPSEPVARAAAEPPPREPDPEPEAEAEVESELQAAAAEPERPEPRGDWAVQLGSFGERENADRLAKRVASFGDQAEVSTTRSGGRTMYRVRVGPHTSRELAEAAASSLSAHGFVAQVVTVD